MSQTYYNTNGLRGEELAAARGQAMTQESAIMKLFNRKGRPVCGTASEVLAGLLTYNYVAAGTPLTSVRRAISNLCKQGKLVKLAQTKMGPLGKPEHLFTQSTPRPE